VIECAAGADVVGGLLNGVGEYRIAGHAKDEVDAVFFASRHHLRAAVMAVTADRLIAAGNGEDASAQDVGQEMGDPVLIAAVREPLGDAEPTLRLGEQHDAAIRSDPSAIKGGGDLLPLNGWKVERQQIIVGHGGRGVL
jgi:hypothetical protein